MKRECGDCQLCCSLLPVRELQKGAGERCRHQKFKKGCTVYDTAAMPFSCVAWNCRWLAGDDTDDQSRPDRSHLVIDVMPDYVTLKPEGEEPFKLQIVQVWCDPKHRDAHRDPAFRRYVMRRGDEGIGTLVRYGSKEGFAIFPPNLSSDGQWHELYSNVAPEVRRPEDLAEFLSGAKLRVEL